MSVEFQHLRGHGKRITLECEHTNHNKPYIEKTRTCNLSAIFGVLVPFPENAAKVQLRYTTSQKGTKFPCAYFHPKQNNKNAPADDETYVRSFAFLLQFKANNTVGPNCSSLKYTGSRLILIFKRTLCNVLFKKMPRPTLFDLVKLVPLCIK